MGRVAASHQWVQMTPLEDAPVLVLIEAAISLSTAPCVTGLRNCGKFIAIQGVLSYLEQLSLLEPYVLLQ